MSKLIYQPRLQNVVPSSSVEGYSLMKNNLLLGNKGLRQLNSPLSSISVFQRLSIISRRTVSDKATSSTTTSTSHSTDQQSSSSTTNNNNNNNNASDSNSAEQQQQENTNEIMLTPGEKVVVGTRLLFWSTVLVFAGACAYYIGSELFPTKMSPNSVFNTSFEIVRNHPDVVKRFGTPLKAYGRDHGGHREGRRNFVEHTEYTDPEDGSKRTRVRYNLEGQAGSAFVFAEVSSDMPSGEFVYILVQDKRNGYVTTVMDNRSALMTKRLAAGNKESEAALVTLLGGGKK